MSATSHPVAPEEIMAFLDGELSADRVQFITEHAESCAACQQVVSSLRSVSQQVSNWQVGAVPSGTDRCANPADIKKRVKDRFLCAPLAKARRTRAISWAAVLATGSLLLMIIAIPNLLRSRMAANEASSVGSLRAINTAVTTYAQKYGHYPKSLEDLGPSSNGQPSESGAGLIDSTLAAGAKSGYRYTYQVVPNGDQNGQGRYTVNAEPLERGTTGHRRFSTDQTGVLSADNVPLDGDPTLSEVGRKLNTGSLGKMQAALINEPMIARTVSLAIVAEKDFDGARASLDKILARHNGYAASLNVSTPQGAARSLQASLRIPAPQLAAALAELKALGHVENETQNGEEITQQHADLAARLKNSRETEQRLQAILVQRTGKISDVLEVEQEIARVRGEIEQMEAQQKALERRVDFATIDLKLSEEYKAKLDSPAPSASTQLHNASVNGYRNVADTLLALLLFFAEYGPVLLLWAMILFTPAWLVWRRWRRAAATV
jgi:hypothetical protein